VAGRHRTPRYRRKEAGPEHDFSSADRFHGFTPRAALGVAQLQTIARVNHSAACAMVA
jgi:hypothetical protein